MYRATVTIEGVSALSQSRQHRTPFLERESYEDYERRTWREKANVDKDGIVFIPAMAFKQAVDDAAKRLAIPDPDNKRATLSKYFISDVICEGHLSIGVHKDDMPKVTINANVDGVRGSGKRVERTFPQISNWKGTTTFLVMDEKITHAVFEKVFKSAGMSIGVGQFRPQKGGTNGRWQVIKIEYEKV